MDPAVESREKWKYLIFLSRICCSFRNRFCGIFGFNGGGCWAWRGRTKQRLKTTGPKVSKIGQAGRRSGAGKGAENRESWNGEVGAFNIFLVNLTAPFLFIVGLGVQVLSAWVRGRLIFNFISPSLHFIDGVACRRRHLSHTSLCSWFMRPVRLLRQRIFQRFRRRYPEAPPRSCPRSGLGSRSAFGDRSFVVEELLNISKRSRLLRCLNYKITRKWNYCAEYS